MLVGLPNHQKHLAFYTKHLELDKSYKSARILSGGNKRKLCTALTLLCSPKLAYYDEPTTGLDPISRRNLLRLIKASNSSVLFTTHRLDEAEYLCSRLAVMQNGSITFDGTVDQLKSKFSLDTRDSQGNLLKQ